MTETTNRRVQIVSIAGALLVQLCVGIIYLWSVLKGNVAESFEMSDAAAKMISSYMLTGFVLGGLIGGILTDRFAPKMTAVLGVILFALGVGVTGFLRPATASLLPFTYGILGGLGSGIAYSANISIVQRWLPNRRGLATGLAIGSFGFSTVIFAPVFRALMLACTESSGLVNFRMVFLILAGVFTFFGLLGCCLIRLPTAPAAAKAHGEGMTLAQAAKTPSFWYLFLHLIFINGAWNLATPLLYGLGVERGLTPAIATLAVSCTGIANFAGRLTMAPLSDKLGRRKTNCLLAIVTFLAALCVIKAAGVFYIIAICLIAFAFGGPSSVTAAIVADCFGSKNSASIWGVLLLGLGISSLLFNAISGNILHGDIAATFIMGACSALVTVVLMWLLGLEAKKQGRHIG